MRIAILTLPLHINFGGIMQCYALQTILERLGHNVVVLNTNTQSVSFYMRASLFFKRIVKVLLRKELKFYGWKTESEITRKHTDKFIHSHIHLLNTSNLSLLKETDFDAIVVGSDQIWRPMNYYRQISNAYLKFAEDWKKLRRIAYAVSFGTGEWEYSDEETEVCARLAHKFDAISVREDSGIELCHKYLNVDARQSLDPTMLLTKNDYLELLSDAKSKSMKNGGLFYYFLDDTEEKLSIVDKYAKIYGLGPFKANNLNAEKYNLHFERRIQSSVEDWLSGFRDASFVVTDSFHGCVFSIIFNKPFIAIGNKKRGLDRFTSLLSQFGLEKCLIVDYDDELPLLKPDIDWEKVNAKVECLRKESLSFLSEVF